MTTARLTGPNPDRSQDRRSFEFDSDPATGRTRDRRPRPPDRTCRRHRFAAARLWLRDAVRVYLY